MKSQIVYQTNADYEKSYETLKNSSIIASIDQTPVSGLIWFRFVNTKTVFLLSPEGKLSVKWNDVAEKRVLLKLVRSLLVSINGELTIKPQKQQTWIDYPPPQNFKLYWCDETTEYSQKGSEETKPLFTSAEMKFLPYASWRATPEGGGNRFWKHYTNFQIWLARGAKPEEKPKPSE